MEIAWRRVSQVYSRMIVGRSYILRLAIEANERALSRVEVLRGGYGGGDEGERIAQHLEARICSRHLLASLQQHVISHRDFDRTGTRARATIFGIQCLLWFGGSGSCTDLNVSPACSAQ